MINEPVFFIKITDAHNVNSDLLTKYVDEIISESKAYGNLYSDTHSVIFSTLAIEDCKFFIDRFLEDFMTNGESSEELIDIFRLDVYISDPELNSYYVGRRMNVLREHNDILSDIMMETFNQCIYKNDVLEKQVQTIEALNQYNGINKFRKIINVIVQSLETDANIVIADKINEIVKETTH